MSERAASAREGIDRFWERLLAVEPLLATQVGDERFDDRLPDPSEEGVARRETLYREAIATTSRHEREGLDEDLRTSLDMMEAIARRELAAIDHRLDRLQAASHLWGPGQLLAELGSLQRADTHERLARYLARLRAVPAYLDASARLCLDGARLGVTVPGVVADRAIAQVERLLAIEAEETPALAAVPEGDAGGREAVVEVARDVVTPAYARFLEALREYRPHATETIGVSALPDGEAIYAAEILGWTTLSLDPRTVHDLGVEDLERIQEERRQVASALGHGSPAEAEAALHADPANLAETREALVELARRQVERGWETAAGWFGRLPRENCEVRPVEEFREADMPFAFYQSPSEDGTRPGIYYVNASDLPQRPLHHLATTTYHEANPGHHFQLAIEQEFSDRPALRRFGGILAGSSFVEGWGLYSERLADEMGLFEDERERLGMLDAQGMRAARLVVDTGIHALGWDRARAIRQMEEAGVPRVDAVIEVDRYIAMPAQALSYKIGQLEIERWRANAEKRQGASFSLKDFHDRLLSLGSLPLPALQRELGEPPSG